MEVLQKLKEINQGVRAKFDINNALDLGDYKLSIQGSKYHYCTPREGVNIDLYSSMEIAIIDSDGDMRDVLEDIFFFDFKRRKELHTYIDGEDCGCVYGYVPVDLINDLYLYLKFKK